MIMDTGTSIQAIGSDDLYALIDIMNQIGNVNCYYSQYRFVILQTQFLDPMRRDQTALRLAVQPQWVYFHTKQLILHCPYRRIKCY
jgi:hypothetical protein